MSTGTDSRELRALAPAANVTDSAAANPKRRIIQSDDSHWLPWDALAADLRDRQPESSDDDFDVRMPT